MAITYSMNIDSTTNTGNLTFTINLDQIVDINFSLNPLPSFDFSARGLVTLSLSDFKTVIKALSNFDSTLFFQFPSLFGFSQMKKNEFDLSFSKSTTGLKNIHLKFKIDGNQLQDYKWKQSTNEVIFQPRSQIIINLSEWKFFLDNLHNSIEEMDNF